MTTWPHAWTRARACFVRYGSARPCAFGLAPGPSVPLLTGTGNTGANAAIANAVFHATGKRVRDLPIRLDKLQQEEHA